ncbi:hypothetical protein DFO66_103340 [Brevibacterium sanguinis]|uniref:Uncharacterized protein n=2 Tax=Brevibacterium TaxID=1696 RepID=A0A366IN82_9MICO|nr:MULTISPECIES: hypothetical protein [Brevibacterium]RBP66393.1 hypothetical protein DFO66_103340 [Brevibacterium sanguinis]RBP73045.1 hypothetical protein DFO65_103340 [Brevibacterium celere]
MAKLKGHLFARLALDYFDHPKIAALSDSAIVAHLEMIVYSRRYLTDGLIPMRVAMRYPVPTVDELCSNDPSNPSVTRNDDGSLILHDYGDFQELKSDVEDRRRSGRDAAEKRWSGNAGGNAKRNAPGNAPRNTETETETETEIPPISPKGDKMEGFAEFWEVYPRKVARKAAMAKFPKCVKEAGGVQKLIDAAEAYAQSVEGRPIEKIAHPTTWLNQGRWDDELTLNLDDERSSGWSDPLPRANAH